MFLKAIMIFIKHYFWKQEKGSWIKKMFSLIKKKIIERIQYFIFLIQVIFFLSVWTLEGIAMLRPDPMRLGTSPTHRNSNPATPTASRFNRRCVSQDRLHVLQYEADNRAARCRMSLF